MVTLGIDLSSMPKGTAACLIEWANGAAVAGPPVLHATDHILDGLIAQASVVAIDAPFGWPTEFTAAVGEWSHGVWTKPLRDQLSYRATDFAVRQLTGKWPLSVSTDRIGLPAMRAMALLRRHGVTDKSGDGRFYEVYPGGTLSVWGISRKGYKQKKSKGLPDRERILAGMRDAMPWLTVPNEYTATDDSLDALVRRQWSHVYSPKLWRRRLLSRRSSLWL